MQRRILGLVIAVVTGLASGSLAPEARAGARPNLIVILADDMGYSDLGCYGGELKTPSLDRLAAEGVRLTHCYNGGMCVVSRASLMTGQWWPRALPGFKQTPLLSELLHTAGYRTGLIGKWHLKGHPMDRGFDHFYGFVNGFADHFTGNKDYYLDREPIADFGRDYYSSDAFAERAIQFVERGGDQPFFLYLAFQAPHNPLQVPQEDILANRGNYSDGWQSVREARFRRQQKSGLVPADAALPAYPANLPDWSSLSPAQQDLEDLRMAVYASMVERMDRNIGRLVDALENAGQSENTVILFLSDNGTDPFSVADAPLLKQGKLPGDPGSNFQPGTGWAYASVTPWRLYKISQHNGGVASGGIAWWPKATGAAGRIEPSPLHLVDVLPTFLELAQVAPPTGALAGESFVPLLHGAAWQRHGGDVFSIHGQPGDPGGWLDTGRGGWRWVGAVQN